MPKKDAFYFFHDSNAKDDPKCVMLIEQLGLEGYGIYWVLIETLRDQPTYKYPLALLSALARRYNTTYEKMKTVVMQYGLFQIDDNDFFSLALLERMQDVDRKRQQARDAINLRWSKQKLLQSNNASSTDVIRTYNDSNTNVYTDVIQGEKSIEEKKRNKNNISNDILFVDGSPSTRIPYQKIVDIFNEICHTFPKVLSVNDSRKKTLKTAWTDNPSINYFVKLFKMADESTFLSGRDGKWTGCNFDWVIAPKNRVKILEGNYANRDHIKELPF